MSGSRLRVERWYQAYGVNLRVWYQEEAERYLQTVKKRVLQEIAPGCHLTVTCSIAEDPDIAATLIHSAAMGGCVPHRSYDLIALATQGSGKSNQWRVGSIAERLLEGSQIPLLVMRPPIVTTSSALHPIGNGAMKALQVSTTTAKEALYA